MAYLKALLISGILMLQSQNSFCQTSDWSLVGGKAMAEKKILVSGKPQSDIYKDVYRWLIKVYKNPEDILKARLEGEYLRGVGYYLNCVKFGSLSSADLQYSFTFEIKDNEVVFKLDNAYLLYSYSQDDDGMRPIESFLVDMNNPKKKRKHSESEAVLSGLNKFSSTLFTSLESHLQGESKN